MEWSSYITSSIIVVAAVFVMYQVRSGLRFEFITMMLIGLIVTNTFFIFYMLIYNKRHDLEESTTASRGQLLSIVSLSMAADMIRYFAWNLTMWVFAFKYWVISIEMPKAIKNSRTMSIIQKEADRTDQALQNSEHKYKVGLWIGVGVNVFATVLYITFYGKLCMNKGKFVNADLICYSFMNLCGLVSSCFLGDALRRIYIAFKSIRGIAQNEKIMLLHLVVFLTYMVTTAMRTLQVSAWLGDP